MHFIFDLKLAPHNPISGNMNIETDILYWHPSAGSTNLPDPPEAACIQALHVFSRYGMLFVLIQIITSFLLSKTPNRQI
jgi:hypothetical protein